MSRRATRWLTVSLVVGIAMLAATMIALPRIGQAQPGHPAVPDIADLPSTGRDTGLTSGPPILTEQDALGVSGSDVTSTDCYQENASQIFCFTVSNGSTDGEWLTSVRLTFPAIPALGDWQVACMPGFQDKTDSVGYAVNMNCSTPLVNQVLLRVLKNSGNEVH